MFCYLISGEVNIDDQKLSPIETVFKSKFHIVINVVKKWILCTAKIKYWQKSILKF